MSLSRARAVADAVLFDEHLLHPHRATALNNRMRWHFGVLAPRAAGGSDTWFAQTECLLEATARTAVDIRVRCLQLRYRGGENPWDEGIVREFAVPVALDALEQPRTVMFELPAGTERRDGENWYRCRVPGLIHIECQRTGAGLRRLHVRVENRSEWAPGPADLREHVLRRSLAAVHTMFAVRAGRFLSLLDPPEWAEPHAAACRNISTWPVLVGEPAAREAVLSSPVILYDHPAIPAQRAAHLRPLVPEREAEVQADELFGRIGWPVEPPEQRRRTIRQPWYDG